MQKFLEKFSSLNKNLKNLSVSIGITANRYDKKTLLHSEHISKDKGKSGIWRKGLTAMEVDMIEDRYESWLRETGYLS